MSDLITCTQCHNLRQDGRCNAAVMRRLPNAGQRYTPIPDVPQRCVCFLAKAGDPDRRTARERWPELFQ